MQTLDAIAARRSIRRFKSDPVPEPLLRQVLGAALQAPSGKNKQPWRWVVATGARRLELTQCLQGGLAQARARGLNTGSAEWSMKIMEQAPVTVFVFNPYGLPYGQPHALEQMIDLVVDVQSLGAAIENLLLAAHDQGLGALWVCDIFYAYEALCSWLGEPGQLVAAVALGYAAENPPARPRKPASETVRWL